MSDSAFGWLGRINADFRTGLNSAIGASTGTSAADQLDMLVKMNQPTKYGWSWNQLANQLQYEQYVKELDASLSKSSAANLNYNLALNRSLPTAVRQGLEAAGINPLLAVLGNWNQATGSISGSGVGGGSGLGSLPQVSRGGSSGFSASAVNKIMDNLSGKVGAEVSNLKKDTENKEVANQDIKASANLKNAEAENIRAKTETENAMREPERQNKILQSRYGDGFSGSIGRYGETLGEALESTLKDLSDTFPIARQAVNPGSVSALQKLAEVVVGRKGAVSNSSSAGSVDRPITVHGNSAVDQNGKDNAARSMINKLKPLKTRIGNALRRAFEAYGGRR